MAQTGVYATKEAHLMMSVNWIGLTQSFLEAVGIRLTFYERNYLPTAHR